MTECPPELVSIFQQFDGRKVAAGHFTLWMAPQNADDTGNSHVCLRIASVGSSVFHPMMPHINELVLSSERLPSGKYRLWQYFRGQSPCEPISVGEFSTSQELGVALEHAVSLM